VSREPTKPSPKRRRKLLRALALLLLLVGALLFYWNTDIVFFPAKQTATVLVLDDCDDDFKNPPFEDMLLAFGPQGTTSRFATNLNLCQTVGGSRSLSVSADGRFIVACEEVGRHLTAYATQTGKQLWQIDGQFNSATTTSNGMVYALTSTGTIYGDRSLLIDQSGRIVQNGSAAGFDVALDARRGVLWMVGKYIRKSDLQLNVLQELSPIKWCAVSVDVCPDGSIWVAEREHRDVAQSTNRILKISADGQLLKSVYLPWSPSCVRVDPTDGSVWVTGFGVRAPRAKSILQTIERRTGALPLGKWLRGFLTDWRVWSRTRKCDAEGTLLHEVDRGGFSLALQVSDGSVWVTGRDKIYRYSKDGRKLARLGGVSSGQKHLAVIPETAVPGR